MSIYPQNIIQALPISETSGTYIRDISGNNNNGKCSPSGILFGADGIDGNSALNFNGGYIDVNYNEFNGNLYSAIVWGRIVDQNYWSAQETYRWVFHPRSSTNSLYYSSMGRNTSNNQLEWRRRAGGYIISATYEYDIAYFDWFCMGMTADYDNRRVSFYLFDYLDGFKEVYSETGDGIESWPATEMPNGSDTVLYAGNNAATQSWVGHGSHCYLWSGIALNKQKMEEAMTWQR